MAKNELISKIDKKVERNLKKLQGEKFEDDDDNITDEAFDEVLHGSLNKEIENFLELV